LPVLFGPRPFLGDEAWRREKPVTGKAAAQGIPMGKPLIFLPSALAMRRHPRAAGQHALNVLTLKAQPS
jgi:hypothetical protein